jgi:hypothetical protein
MNTLMLRIQETKCFHDENADDKKQQYKSSKTNDIHLWMHCVIACIIVIDYELLFFSLSVSTAAVNNANYELNYRYFCIF